MSSGQGGAESLGIFFLCRSRNFQLRSCATKCARASPCFCLANRRLDDPHLQEYAEALSILVTYFWNFVRHDLGTERHRVLSLVLRAFGADRLGVLFKLGGGSCDRLPPPSWCA